MATKIELLVHSTTRNAPYIHPRQDSIGVVYKVLSNLIFDVKLKIFVLMYGTFDVRHYITLVNNYTCTTSGLSILIHI